MLPEWCDCKWGREPFPSSGSKSSRGMIKGSSMAFSVDFRFSIFDFSIFSLGHTKTCQSLQTTASFPPSGRDLSALLGSEKSGNRGSCSLSLSISHRTGTPAPLLSVSTPTPPFGFIPLGSGIHLCVYQACPE